MVKQIRLIFIGSNYIMIHEFCSSTLTVDCGDPVTNLNVTYTSTFYGETADVTCQDRYIPVTGSPLSGSITCSGSGSWTESGVKCEWGGKAHPTNIPLIFID